MVQSGNDDITSEPLQVLGVDDSVSCAQYELGNIFLTIDGWRRFRGIAKKKKRITFWLDKQNYDHTSIHRNTAMHF